MPEISFEKAPHVFQGIATWAASKPIQEIYGQEGGWEGWAQVELALFIHKLLGGSTAREVQVYSEKVFGERDRADLVNTNKSTGVTTIFELKCQSFGQDEFFGGEFIIDISKLDIATLKQEYRNADKVALGLAVGSAELVEAAIEALSDKNFDYVNNTFWIRTPNNGPTVFYTIVKGQF